MKLALLRGGLPQEESVAGHSGLLSSGERSEGKANSLSYRSGGMVVFGDSASSTCPSIERAYSQSSRNERVAYPLRR